VTVGGLIPGTDLEGAGRIGVATFGDGQVASIIGTKTSDRTDIDIMQSVHTVFETVTLDTAVPEGSGATRPATGGADNADFAAAASVSGSQL
jgi:hypothetical protein